MKKIGVVLFTTDLRLHDNETLLRAIQENNEIIPLFCWDDVFMNSVQFGFNRVSTIRQYYLEKVLRDLNQRLKDIGGYLLLIKGNQKEALIKLFEHYKIHKVYTKKQVGFEEKKENEKIKNWLLTQRVDFEEYSTSTMYYPSDLPFSISTIPEVFSKYRKIVEKEAVVRSPMDPPEKIFCPEIPENLQELTSLSVGSTINPNHSLPEIGGETSALKHLQSYIFDQKHILHYKKTRNNLIGIEFSSKFSPWLALGCLSPKYIYHKVQDFERTVEANDSTYWLLFELLWRDFFRFSFKKYPSQYYRLHGILGNSNRKENSDLHKIESWVHGETSNLFINAAMKELKTTGWTSNRMRQIVASYFIYDLEQDWRIGAAYFESQLVDYDVSSNWGNWAYIAGVGNDPRAGRKFNTDKQEEQYDGDKRYQNIWNTF
jgi:deoxyribodipyrimidine photo-lyase